MALSWAGCKNRVSKVDPVDGVIRLLTDRLGVSRIMGGFDWMPSRLGLGSDVIDVTAWGRCELGMF